MNELEFVGEVAHLLKPYLEDLVVAGGFAVELFHLHPMVGQAAKRILTTRDLDLAAPDDLQVFGGSSLKERLVEAGFTEELRGNSQPPFSELVPPAEWGAGYSIELLVPLHGPKEKGVTNLHGFGAAQLRYIDLLLRDPWTLTAAQVPNLPADAKLCVVHPAAYLAQKILTVAGRANPEKQRKDRAYCYTVVARARDRAILGQETLGRARERGGQAAKNLQRRALHEFGSPAAQGIRDAARYLTALGPRVPPERVYEVMTTFLAEIGVKPA